MVEQMENVDDSYKRVLEKIKKLTPKELCILEHLLESYFDSLEKIKKYG